MIEMSESEENVSVCQPLPTCPEKLPLGISL